MSPRSGHPTGGATVTIKGSGFEAGAVVRFGSVSATVSNVEPSVITVTSPPGTGKVDVTVQTAAGTSLITPKDRFTYKRR